MALASPAAAATPRVLAIHFAPDLEVNPVTQGWVNHELERAKDKGYDAAVIVLDTPGGLLTSMRKIYQKELSSPIPVIVYVAPDGARAASAGLWIAEAADVLAMAPQTNIGASTPINAGGTDLNKDLRKKAINDAVASVSRPRQDPRPEHEVPGARGAPGGEHPRVRSAAAERHRRGRADAARTASAAGRLQDEAEGLHAASRRRADRQRQARLLHAPAQHADRPEHHRAALPRRHRRDRLRDLPSRRRAAGSAGSSRARRLAVRLLRAACQLGGVRPAAARSCPARDRRACDELTAR